MSTNEKRYVVSTCHDGTDWCVRDATDEEVIEGEWVSDHRDALDLAASTAAEYGCRYYDFSTGGHDGA